MNNITLFLYRFFTEEECIGTCKDAKRSNKKKVVCPHGAPTCELGCVLGRDESDQGTCLTCICNKNQDSGKSDPNEMKAFQFYK